MKNATGCLEALILWVIIYLQLHLNNEKQIIQIKHNRINWQEETSLLFTSVTEDLKSGQLRTNPANGPSGTQTGEGDVTKHSSTVTLKQIKC